MRAIIRESERVRQLFPNMLSHNNIGKGIGFYSNGDRSYQTIVALNKTGGEIAKITFNVNGATSISVNAKYLSPRSLGSMVSRLKKITGEEAV